MKLSTRGRYALRVMIDLADNMDDEESGLVKLRKVAERQEISKDYIVHLLIALKTAGLVRSASGKNGGYTLAQPPDKINVLEIVEASIGQINILDCLSDESLCNRVAECRSRHIWNIVNEKIKETLASITLEQIADSKCDLEMLLFENNSFPGVDKKTVCARAK